MPQRLFAILLAVFCYQPAITFANLENHPSPYLRLHANDPVQWQSWGDDVIREAQNSGKLIYLSIGYFSCHWCHVMQKESYQDKAIGDYLNEHYISVKVDRELRPELDRRMMAFVEAVRGSAGWPLNVFLTPQGYPVTGFSYLPKDQFLSVLGQLRDQWSTRQQEIAPAAKSYFEQTEQVEAQSTLVNLPATHFDKMVDALVAQSMGIADELQGGFGDTTKFPSYPQMQALIKAISYNKQIDPDVSAFVQLTLDNMAKRHLQDAINYGFFRYTTDPEWETPHYEKMLYDNAQLAYLYLDAASLWGRDDYLQVGLQTLEFLEMGMKSAAGGYVSSISAVDENNNEGAGYLWQRNEVEKVLTREEIKLLESKQLLPEDDRSFQFYGLQDIPYKPRETIRKKLMAFPKAVMPADEKRLASWNALVMLALLKAESQSDNPVYEQRLKSLYKVFMNDFIQGDRVLRFAGQKGAAESTLEDYAYISLALAQYGLQFDDEKALKKARQLVEKAFDVFYQDGKWKPVTQTLVPGNNGSWLIQDGVLDAPSTVLLQGALLIPGLSSGHKALTNELISRMTRDMLDIPYYYASTIMLRKQQLTSNQSSARTAAVKQE